MFTMAIYTFAQNSKYEVEDGKIVDTIIDGRLVVPEFAVKSENYLDSVEIKFLNTILTDCSITGYLIYKEDFKGNSTSAPRVSPIDLIGGRSDLIFNGVNPGSGNYGLIKYVDASSTAPFLYNDDHTYPNDRDRGYFMYIDPAPNQMDAILYEYDITGLCSGISKMSFTAWMVDLQTAYARPKIEMQVLDMNTGDVIKTTGTFMLPRQSPPAGNPSNPAIWHQYGFIFDLPLGVSDITFRLINKEVDDVGNDWAMDDIEIHLCIPPVTIIVPSSSDTTVCEGFPITLEGTYIDDGTFGSNLTYRWEYSLSGNINDPNEWTTLTTSTGTSPLNATYSILSMSNSDTGFYRLLVGTSTSIDRPNCRATSAPVTLHTTAHISTFPSPPEGGSTTGDGCYEIGDQVIVTATPKLNYVFVNWSEDGTMISTNSSYSFIVTKSRVLRANFELKPLDTYEIIVLANPPEGGVVTGGGIYNYDDFVTVKATPKENYHFIDWTENSILVYSDTTYSFTVTKNRTLVANFNKLDFDTYAVIICDRVILLNLRKLVEDGYEVIGCKWYKNGIEVKETYATDECTYIEGSDKLLETAPTYYMYCIITKNYGELCSTEKIIINHNKALVCNEIENSNNLMAYPNPVMSGGLLTLEGVIKGSPIYAYNYLGACVFSTIATENIMSLILDLPQGIYLIRNEDKIVRIVTMK